MYNYLFKCVIVGNSNVGKSCLLLKFINNNFKENKDLTIGVEFGTKIINIDKNQNFNNINLNELSNNDIVSNNEIIPIKLQIWDTAGQETFRSLIRAYYRAAAGVLLVYDISNRRSFDNILNWLNEVNLYNTNNNPVIILVGNKNDLEENREVSIDEGLILAQEKNLLFIECSAKTSHNLDLLFKELARHIYLKIKNNLNKDNNMFNKNGICIMPSIEKKSCYNCK